MKLKTLNGAPLREHLDFSEKTLIDPAKFTLSFTNGPYSVAGWPSFETEKDSTTLKWRSLGDERLRTGWSQPYLPRGAFQGDQASISFSLPNVECEPEYLADGDDLTNADTTVTLGEDETTSGSFLQHSIMLHDTLQSSQIAIDEAGDRTVSSSSFVTNSFGTSFGTTGSEFSSPTQKPSHAAHSLMVPPTIIASPLVSLPDAQHLRSLYPQTPTPNLVAVLIAPPQSREVLVKKHNYKMNLHEITVADDTKSGFKISFWTRPKSESKPGWNAGQEATLSTLEKLKVGDILLLRNIALSLFRDEVHGQSLNPSITRARTSIDILMNSNGVSAEYLSAMPASVTDALARVKKWAKVHVASDYGGSRKRKGSAKETSAKRTLRNPDHGEETFPPDSLLLA